MKKIYSLLCSVLCFGIAAGTVSARTFELASPDGGIKMNIDAGDRISYNVWLDGKQIIEDSYLSLTTRDKTYGVNAKFKNSKTSSENSEFTPVAALKFATIKNNYNQLTLNFRDGFSVEFRAYDDGVAYRFVTSEKGNVEVIDEEFSVNFPDDYKAHLQQVKDFRTSYEEPYSHPNLAEWKVDNYMATLPALFETPDGAMVLICESNVLNYPQLFIKGTGGNAVTSIFQKYMLEQRDRGDRAIIVTKEADCIARTSGTREYPWRYFVIVKDAAGLMETTMTARLAPKSVIEDTSWIKPGLISWEWWSGSMPFGPDVNFESGRNTETYKYFIDFAAKYGIPYIIMDEGWAARTQDPFTPNPDVDMKELVSYGNSKNVGIMLWITCPAVEHNFGVFEEVAKWGVKGLKIDFMDRNDQWMTEWYERVMVEAAKHKLLILFHGTFKPGGLEYKYPNLLTYEGVRGMEQRVNCRPENSVWLPLIRNVAGAMDYTPGAMFSMQPNVFAATRPYAGSIGTRAYQMALFVLFESGLQMIADNPTLYYREPECTEYMTSVPVTWDETRPLAVKPGQYVSVAKRKGGKWFLGAMSGLDKPNWTDIEVTLDFLDAGREYTMTWFEDGINAPRQAMDYRKKTAKVKKGDKVTMRLARNGGWAGVIE